MVLFTIVSMEFSSVRSKHPKAAVPKQDVAEKVDSEIDKEGGKHASGSGL